MKQKKFHLPLVNNQVAPLSRSKFYAVSRFKKENLRILRQLEEELPNYNRYLRFFKKPKTRGDCVNVQRPCPWVSCKYHLATNVKPNGTLEYVYHSVSITDITESCALDVAEQGGLSSYDVGKYLNLSGQQIKNIEKEALKKLKKAAESLRKELDE